MPNGISITELARATGIRQQRLCAWQDAGFITPLLTRKGTRIVRIYLPAVVDRVKRLKTMVDAGYRVSKATEIIDAEKPLIGEQNEEHQGQ